MTDKTIPDKIEELLPWYVNGTLGEAETDRVAAALRVMDDGEKRLANEVALSRRVAETPAPVDAMLRQRDAAYDSLRSRISVAASTAPPAPNRRRPGASSVVATLSVCVVAVAAAMGWWSFPKPAEYSTMSRTVAPNSAVIVQVAANRAVTRRAMDRVADHLGARIVSGPSPRNVYLFALPAQSDPATDLIWIRRQPEVTLAEIQAR